MQQLENGVEWKRVRDVFDPKYGYSLWGKNGISIDDVAQGAIYDCYMMASFSSLAQYPERVERMFMKDDESTNGLSHNGIYAINMYALMMPITVTIDDRLPFYAGTNTLMHAQAGRD